MPPNPARLEHSWLEDAHAIFMGSLFIFLGLVLLRHAGLTTGGIAGLALLMHFASGLAVALLFFALNLPFYYVSYVTMGREFTAKSVLVNVILLGAGFAERFLLFELTVEPTFAAIAGGTLAGMGVLALARHSASVGGFTSIALLAQKRWGVPAAYVQFGSDAVILAASTLVISAGNVVLSALSIFALSAVLLMNHKPGRYMGY